MNTPCARFNRSESKGAALIIVLAFVVLLTGLVIAYFSRTTTDRQLAQSSFNDTAADLLARSALDIVVSDLKQEIASDLLAPVSATNIQPSRYGAPASNDPQPIPNLIRRSFSGDPTGRTSSVSSTAVSANGRSVSLARWNSHYLIPRANASNTIDSTPVSSFIAPDWVLITPQGPASAPAPSAVIGRYAYAVYDEGGLIDINVGGFPTYASLTVPTQTLAAKYAPEHSQIRRVKYRIPSRAKPASRRAPYTLAARAGTSMKSSLTFGWLLAAGGGGGGGGQAPNFTPQSQDAAGTVNTQFSFLPNVNHNPTSFSTTSQLPAGLSLNTTNGTIFGTPTRTGTFNVVLTATNAKGSGTGTVALTITGASAPAGPTPWPVNLARKGIIAFADLTAFPSTPTVITPTTAAGSMGGFPSTTQINKIMGWRNYATTQQPTSASFDTPSFPLASADNYAKYFLAVSTITKPFTTVRNDLAPVNGRTDQAVMTRSELLKLQRTICTDPVTGSYDDTKFPQSLLQYLGTFSREQNRPAPDWPQLNGKLQARWDINHFDAAIPYPVVTGKGHGRGQAKKSEVGKYLGLAWVDEDTATYPYAGASTDPRHYGHWVYIGHVAAGGNPTNPVALSHIPALKGGNPDFFQILDYAMTRANGEADDYDPNHLYNTFYLGASLIDQYDTDDQTDSNGNTITIIDYDSNTADYAYGVESMSFDDPLVNLSRPPSAPYPPGSPVGYIFLNRRFENVGEFGYAYNPASTTTSKTLDFFTSTSTIAPILDFFTYNTASPRAGIVNLNTRNGPVLASIIKGALLNDPGAERLPTVLVSQQDALTAAQAIVQETTSTDPARGPALTRRDVARLAAKSVQAVPAMAASDETRNTISRVLAEVGQTRTWNLMIDVIAQTGKYAPATPDLTDPKKFIVQGEKRYWLHLVLDRDTEAVLGAQLEEVTE